MMDWKAQKRACDNAARSDAEEGENRRSDWTARGLQERYDKAYRERRAQIEATEAEEERLAPLRQIRNQADALASRSDNEEVRELSDMIRDLADYLESNQHG